MIGDGLVHQSRAVRKQQMLANDAQMMSRLLGCEQPRDDAARHRQQRIPKPGPDVGRMEQELRRIACRREQAIPGDRSVADEETIEVAAHCQREAAQLFGGVRSAAPGAALRRSA